MVIPTIHRENVSVDPDRRYAVSSNSRSDCDTRKPICPLLRFSGGFGGWPRFGVMGFSVGDGVADTC